MEWTISNFDKQEVVMGWKDDPHTYYEFNRMPVDWRRSLTNVLTGVPMMRRQTTVSLWRHGLVAAAACLLGLAAAVGADAPKDTKFPQPIEPSTVAGLMVMLMMIVPLVGRCNF